MNCEINWELFWNALSAIGTLLAVSVALFMPYWQILIQNKKKLSLSLSTCIITEDNKVTEKRLSLSFLNKGFKDETVHSVYFKINKDAYLFNDNFRIPPSFTHIIIKFDSSTPVHYNADHISTVAKLFIENKKVKASDKVVLFASDTGGKSYNFKTDKTYQYLVDLVKDDNEQKS